MSILSDKSILKAIANRGLDIQPLLLNDVQPASVDLHLGETLHEFSASRIDLSTATKDQLKALEKEIIYKEYELKPNSYVVIDTKEVITISQRISAKILNRNSLARFGLDVSCATFLNPGFSGRKPLLIRNFGVSTIVLHPGDKICQIEFSELDADTNRTYAERHDISAFDMAVAQAVSLQSAVDVKDKVDADAFSLYLKDVIKKE